MEFSRSAYVNLDDGRLLPTMAARDSLHSARHSGGVYFLKLFNTDGSRQRRDGYLP